MTVRGERRFMKCTPADQDRLRALREQFQRERPSPGELRALGHAFVPVGEVQVLRTLLASLRQVRQHQNLTLRELAERTGIDEPALSRLETGKNLNPTWETLAKVAKALGLAIRVELQQRSPLPGDRGPETREIVSPSQMTQVDNRAGGNTMSQTHINILRHLADGIERDRAYLKRRVRCSNYTDLMRPLAQGGYVRAEKRGTRWYYTITHLGLQAVAAGAN